MYASEAINKAFILKPQSAVFVYEDLESGARETWSSNPPTHPPPPSSADFTSLKVKTALTTIIQFSVASLMVEWLHLALLALIKSSNIARFHR